MIIDGGTKTFSSDRFLSNDGRGYGLVKEEQDADLAALSEDHGQIDIARSARHYRIGEKLTIIPNHVCPIYRARSGRVEAEWNVAARGKVR